MKEKTSGLGLNGLKDDRINSKKFESQILQSSNPTNPNSDKGELPKGWKWVNLKDICNIIGGITKGKNYQDKQTIYLPYLRVANVQDGVSLKSIDFDQKKTWSMDLWQVFVNACKKVMSSKTSFVFYIIENGFIHNSKLPLGGGNI
jgi:hypothetical protein